MSSLQEAREKLESAIIRLIHNQPFYAHLILNMKHEFVTRIPTMGVSVTSQVNLYCNPHFLCSLSDEAAEGVLIHECDHIIMNHMVRFKDMCPEVFNKEPKDIKRHIEDMMEASTWNKAADLAINELNTKLPKTFNLFNSDGSMAMEEEFIEDDNGQQAPNPKFGQPIETKPLFVDDLKKQFPQAEKLKHMEYYHDFLKQIQKNGGNGKGKGQGEGSTIDVHGTWGEGEELDSEYVTEKVKQAINKAVEACGGREAGNIPANILQAIEKLNYRPKNWRGDIRRFVARASEVITEASRKIRNRRYGILYAGNKTFPQLHLGVGVDSSGSVHDEALNQCFAEIGQIHSLGIKVTVIVCDTKVNEVFEYDPKKPIKITGRGGTAMTPLFDKAAELDIDGLIMVTDGEWCDTVKKPKFPVLFALYEGCRIPYSWGSKTEIKINKKK
jgi:predicted metal-dependent peptidase